CLVDFRTSLCFFFQAEDGIRDFHVTGVQTCALPIFLLGVQDDVRGLVQGGLGGLGGGQGCVDDDAAGAVGGGVAVGLAGDRRALDGPALAGEVVGHGLEDAERVVSGEAVGDGAGVLGL